MKLSKNSFKGCTHTGGEGGEEEREEERAGEMTLKFGV